VDDNRDLFLQETVPPVHVRSFRNSINFQPGFFSDFAGVAVAAGDAEAAGGVVAGDPVAEGAGVATVAGDGEATGFALFVSGSALHAANVSVIAITKNNFFIMIISF
jgi:hypothetical protein